MAKPKTMHLQNFDASSTVGNEGSRSDRLLSRSIDLLAAVTIGLLVAFGIWLWQSNGENVAIAAILNGIANCF